jgi:hypothetical protein
LLEERGVARLEDGTLYRAVSFKEGHGSVERVAADWSRRSCRGVGKIAKVAFVLSDGRQFSLESVQFADD